MNKMIQNPTYRFLPKGYKPQMYMFVLAVLLLLSRGAMGSDSNRIIGQPVYPGEEPQSEVINGYRVARGERPPIDYNNISTDAWEKGVLLVKFGRHTERHLHENPAYTDRHGVTRFNLEEIDNLNAAFAVQEATPYFHTPALRDNHTARHKAWGFHLWYKFHVDEGADILRMMKAYLALPDVEMAQPVFRKKLISGEKPTDRQSEDATTRESSDTWLPNDPDFNDQWHYSNTGQTGGTPGADISIPEAWSRETGHNDVIVAIIDSGVDHTHEDLAGNMWPNIGYNFANNTETIVPGNHGTHVAGTVAAVSNNSVGVSGIAGGDGSSDGVQLMSLQVFSPSGNGGFHLAPVYAADNGAAISQNSWGYTSPNVYEQPVLDAIDYFNTYGGSNVMEGGITIFAAGNSDSESNWYPAYYEGAMAVASTTHKDEKSSFSNYGSWIDISAPGGGDYAPIISTYINNSYGGNQGTSMACPHVSGVAALLLSKAHRNNFSLTSDDTWNLLVDYTDNHYHANPGYQNKLGSGRLNANFSLNALGSMLHGIPNPIGFSATSISTSEIELTWAPNADEHEVMIAWSEENNFGIPENETAYAIGDVLPYGGGTILCQGDLNSFIHSGLDKNTFYYYKAFSVDEHHTYSSGRVTSAKTLGPNLLVTGLNRKYTQIPRTQLPDTILLKAQVENTGTDLNEEVNLLFNVQEDNYTGSAMLPSPFNANDTATLTSDSNWLTSGLGYGSYAVEYEADHEGSDLADKRDVFNLTVSNNLYSHDIGEISGGVGGESATLMGMKYEVREATLLTSVQVQWSAFSTGYIQFQLALYEVDENNETIQTVIPGNTFTRHDGMSLQTMNFRLNNPVVLEPGTYMLGIRQLGSENIAIGYDDTSWGYFYLADNSSSPQTFIKHESFGNITLRMRLFELEATTWAGTENEDWHEENNWSSGAPNSQMGASIITDTPHGLSINDPAGVYHLTMESGSSLIDNENLTIHGRFRMERYIDASSGWGGNGPATDWQLVAAPVENQGIDSEWTPSGADGGYDFYAYQENPPAWLNQKQPDNNLSHFTPGKGYLVAYENAGTKSFEGPPNTGDIEVSLSKEHDGWNLLGNPYPSAIDWNKVLDHADYFEDVYAYRYDKDKEGGAGYVTVDGSESQALIPVNEGFFVKAKEDGLTFTFTNEMRDHENGIQKDEITQPGELVFRLSNADHYDQTILRTRGNASFDRDPLDAIKLRSFDENVPQLFSITGDKVEVAVNSIPYVDANQSIPLGMYFPQEGEYTFSIEDKGDAFNAYEILLLDTQEDITQDLQHEPQYRFYASNGDDTDRFVLYFNESAVNVIEPKAKASVRAWYHNQTLYVVSTKEDTQVVVYDDIGRQLQTFHTGKGEHAYLLSLGPGVYIAEVYNTDEVSNLRFIVE